MFTFALIYQKMSNGCHHKLDKKRNGLETCEEEIFGFS